MRHCLWISLILISGSLFIGCSRKADTDEPKSSNQPPGTAPTDTFPTYGVWMTDFEAAQAKAAEEDKDLLVDFSGSDWCYWCQRLDGEVFSKPGFVDAAQALFVLVKIDFPSDKSNQSQQLRTQNQQLSRRYGIRGYPTVLLMRPDGVPYAETGYREGGPNSYLTHLKDLRQQR